MFELHESTESALCVGIAAALIWGLGLSYYGFNQPPGQLSWMTWGAQLFGGILACLIVPLVFVIGRDRVLAMIRQPGER